ncbi:GHKL domain-containing protein [Cohnella sp. CFH 77786]|uniref:sensor histidine kinase n=1 Tax=Cohnella sp. CFH 77786 TaxID=2662265 RepID=UPI001C60FED3|nr:HAMP domain-containing sensor histidine kinase [Cohnella sp. CFH 77786]MBW5447502.1 GHKL domain-containing protein [Cohnella sp. CFH 77786]
MDSAFFFVEMLFAASLLADREDRMKFWLAVSLICASLFELNHFLLHWLGDLSAGFPHAASLLFSFLHLSGIPYAFLMAAAAYHGSFFGITSRWIGPCLLLPLFLTVPTLDDGQLNPDNLLFYAWAKGYLVLALVLMTAELTRKRGARPRTRKIVEAFLIMPNMLAALIFHYSPDLFGDSPEWEAYAIYPMAGTCFLYLLIILASGLLGIRIRLERQVVEGTFRSVTMGTAMLNHSIKNRLINIELLANQILEQPEEAASNPVRGDADQIRAETRHLFDMIKRIQHRTAAINLNEQAWKLSAIVQEAAASCAFYRIEKHPKVCLAFPADAILLCDRVHLQEAIVNILNNALDALPEQGGEITVSVGKAGKGLALEIRDNGTGIPSDQLPHIMDMFYSTKDKSHNFGLGLSYTYMVVEKHNGKLQIQSSPGKGTVVRILLPSRRILREFQAG